MDNKMLSLIPKVSFKRQPWWYKLVITELGRQRQAESWCLLANLENSRAVRDPVWKNKKWTAPEELRNDSHGSSQSYKRTSAHVHSPIHIHLHTHECAHTWNKLVDGHGSSVDTGRGQGSSRFQWEQTQKFSFPQNLCFTLNFLQSQPCRTD